MTTLGHRSILPSGEALSVWHRLDYRSICSWGNCLRLWCDPPGYSTWVSGLSLLFLPCLFILSDVVWTCFLTQVTDGWIGCLCINIFWIGNRSPLLDIFFHFVHKISERRNPVAHCRARYAARNMFTLFDSLRECRRALTCPMQTETEKAPSGALLFCAG